MNKKVVIVGGVAGGASAAARLRRLDESAEIVVFERGPYVSFANCGLPYHIGNVIKEKEDLLLMTPELFNQRFNFDVRVYSEVIGIDRSKKEVTVLNLKTGQTYRESYTHLILSPGAEPFIPPIKGLQSAPYFKVRDIPDIEKIIQYIKDNDVKSATIIGGGYIGIEMAENFAERKMKVDVIEMMPQVLGQFDYEMAQIIHQEIGLHGVSLHLNERVVEISKDAASKELIIKTDKGSSINSQLLIVAVGIKPESKLAKEAGLEVNQQGYIVVDEKMQTSDPNIYAVGDVIEVVQKVTGAKSMVPLAGPANRQGRTAAEAVVGKETKFQGVFGTAVIKVFGVVAASTGLNERQIKNSGIKYEKVYAHPNNHAGYYPGAATISMKLIFEVPSGKILGAQAIGASGAEKRIDVIATAMHFGGTVFDLQHLELAYAPPFSSAKDPVNMLGFIASNVIKGDMKIVHWHDMDSLNREEYVILDVRTKPEYQLGNIPGSINISDLDLRKNLHRIPKDKKIAVYCEVGFRGYLATRTLMQLGYDAYNLTGGYKTYKFAKTDPKEFFIERPEVPEAKYIESTIGRPVDDTIPASKITFVDARGITCPGPLNSMRAQLKALEPERYLRIAATDPGFLSSVKSFMQLSQGIKLISMDKQGDTLIFTFQKLANYKDALGDMEFETHEEEELDTEQTKKAESKTTASTDAVQQEVSVRPPGIPAVSELSAEELYKKLKENKPPAIIIDVRQKSEWNNMHLKEAVLIPLNELEDHLDELEKYKKKEVITICHSGARSLMAAKLMEAHGFEYIRSVRGGMVSWVRNKYPYVGK